MVEIDRIRLAKHHLVRGDRYRIATVGEGDLDGAFAVGDQRVECIDIEGSLEDGEGGRFVVSEGGQAPDDGGGRSFVTIDTRPERVTELYGGFG